MSIGFAGRDYQQILEMQKKLKNEIKSFDVILLLFNGQLTRYLYEFKSTKYYFLAYFISRL